MGCLEGEPREQAGGLGRWQRSQAAHENAPCVGECCQHLGPALQFPSRRQTAQSLRVSPLTGVELLLCANRSRSVESCWPRRVRGQYPRALGHLKGSKVGARVGGRTQAVMCACSGQ